jgi:GNAT superfamily N-acetyltransferase
MTLTHDDVVRAVDDWLWVPEDGQRHDSPDGVLVRWPSWFEHPASLMRFHPRGDPAAALKGFLDRARDLGADRLQVWVTLGADDGLDDVVRAAGGVHEETLAVLALDLTEPRPDLDVDSTLDLERDDTDLATHRDYYRLNAEVFGGSMPNDEDLEASLARQLPHQWSVVAYADGRPVGSGGITLAQPVGRLWGGCVVEDARGRGVYRTILDARLRAAADAGCTMALVKGNTATSGPILTRAGFTTYGEERLFQVPLA